MIRWKKIKFIDGDYSISNNGKVRNNKPKYKNKIILKPYKNKYGYLTISLKRKQYLIHRLVAILFIENPYNKLTVNHIDGIKDNNNVRNLEWCTLKENIIHAFNNGLNGGCKQNTSKLTKKQVLFIRENYKLYDKKYGISGLAKKFNINKSSIHKILNNTSYRFLKNSNYKPNLYGLKKDEKEYIIKNYIPYDKNFGLYPLSKKFNTSTTTINKIVGKMDIRITKDDVIYIRKLYKARDKNFGCKAFAKRFKVNERTIWKIINNKIDYTK